MTANCERRAAPNGAKLRSTALTCMERRRRSAGLHGVAGQRLAERFVSWTRPARDRWGIPRYVAHYKWLLEMKALVLASSSDAPASMHGCRRILAI